MEWDAFWRARDARFLQLAKADGAGAGRFHALRLEGGVPPELLTDSDLTRASPDPPVASADEHVPKWILAGPDNERARALLHDNFKAEARMAAVAAAVAAAGMTDQAKLEAWLDLIVRTTPARFHSYGDGNGKLPQLLHASAELSGQLAGQADLDARSLESPTPTPIQDYPRMLYRGATDDVGRLNIENHRVGNADEERTARAEGWVRKPDEAAAAEQARQEAAEAVRRAQDHRALAEELSRVLDGQEKRRNVESPPSPVVDQSAAIPISQQLRHQMEILRLQTSDLKEAVKLHPRTVERHVSGKREPRKLSSIRLCRPQLAPLFVSRSRLPFRRNPFGRNRPRSRRNKRSQKAAKSR